MSDLAKWKVHGPVKTLKTEFAEWDLNQGEWGAWGPPRRVTFCIFRPDGNISESDHHNPDGSIAHSRYLYSEAGHLVETRFWIDNGPPEKYLYFYDEAERHIRTVHVNHNDAQREAEACSYDGTARKTKVSFVDPHRSDIPQGYSIEGSENFYFAPGAITLTVHYDERHQPTEGLFHDAHRHLISRVVFIRDNEGRLLSEENYMGEQGLFPDSEKLLEGIPMEDRDGGAPLLKKLFSAREPFIKTTYEYDSHGMLMARKQLMSAVSEERTTFRFDDRGNPIEETTENNSRDVGIDNNGEWRTVSESSRKQQVRFDYKYDARGNWTERIVWIQYGPRSEFQRSNFERREISYYED